MLSYAFLSKPGERDQNEDYTGMQQKGESYCFILADGLGGHGGGDEASRIVVEGIRADFARNGAVSPDYLKRCFALGQWLLLEKQKKQHRKTEMKTTLTVLLTGPGRVMWGHIGDSRIYYFQDKKFKMRTLDHSVPQMLVAAGKLKEKQIRGHADRNRLLCVMGVEWEKPQYEIAQGITRGGGEAFLLCSDGFWEWVLEKQMQRALKKADTPDAWLEIMEHVALKNGAGKHMDNYSAVAVFL